MRQKLSILIVCVLLGACSEGPWNNPHGPESTHEVVYYSNFSQRPKHLDPVRSYSSDESRFIDQIYEPPLQYHYLKRPYELEPLTLERMPEVSYLDEHKNPIQLPLKRGQKIAYSQYLLTLKQGIRYQPHPAFAVNETGQPEYNFRTVDESAQYQTLADFAKSGSRELIADDYLYQVKRLADPSLSAPIRGLLSQYIVGMSAFTDSLLSRRQQQAGAWINLNELDMSGLKKLDRYRFTITLKGKYPQFKYWLAFHFFAPVPMEVDRFYHLPGLADRNISLNWHPVGTGAFMMTKNDPNSEIVLRKNPNYHGERYPSEGESSDLERGLLEDAGEVLPFIDKASFRLEKEPIPVWTKFTQGYYDRTTVNRESFDQAVNVSIEGTDLSDEMIAMGIQLERTIKPGTYYTGINMLDPVLGGYSESARKLRQAIAIAYNQEEYLSIFVNGQGEAAMGPIPPGIFGYLSGKEGLNPQVYNWENGVAKRKPIAAAKRLMAEAGYPEGRNAKTGEPLVLNLDSTSRSADDKAQYNWMIKKFRQLGIQLNIRATDYNRFKEKMETGNAQIFQWGWIADYPDAENFMFLLYGPNSQVDNGGSGVNSTNYKSAEYDRLFDRMQLMEDSPERLAIIKQMLDILHRDTPWGASWHPLEFILNNPWVGNSKPHGISKGTLKYLKIDTELRAQQQKQRNQPLVWPIAFVALLLALAIVPGWLAYRRRQAYRVRS